MTDLLPSQISVHTEDISHFQYILYLKPLFFGFCFCTEAVSVPDQQPGHDYEQAFCQEIRPGPGKLVSEGPWLLVENQGAVEGPNKT